MAERALLSIVVPALNEEANLAPLHEQLVAALADLDLEWELILVDDGSEDGTRDVVRRLHEGDARVKALFLSRNFGHETASTAGLDAARGDAVVLMDADLQDPPAVIPKMVAKWREGYDIVSAQRVGREGESVFKRGSAYLFYRLMDRLVGWQLPLDAGDFRLVNRAALDAFLQCREQNRFVRGLVAWTGFRQATVSFDRAGRCAGESKYGLRRLTELAATSLTAFSMAPLRVATWLGLAIVLCALVCFTVLAVRALTDAPVSGHALLLASLWFVGGVQCLFIGVLGEYVGRTYVEVQRRPLYFVQESLGIRPPGAEGPPD